MNKLFLIFFSLLVYLMPVNNLIAQISVGMSSTFEIGDKKIYNKKTGELITKKEFKKLIKDNPKVALEPQINKFGEIDSFLLNSEDRSGRMEKDISKRVLKGERFPSFVMKTYQEELINSDSLKGSVIILNFQLMVSPPVFVKNNFKEYDDLIKRFQKDMPLESLMVTHSDKYEVIDAFEEDDFVTKIIPNGNNWSIRYLVTNYPSIIIIDKSGKLIGYFDSLDLKKIEAMLQNL